MDELEMESVVAGSSDAAPEQPRDTCGAERDAGSTGPKGRKTKTHGSEGTRGGLVSNLRELDEEVESELRTAGRSCRLLVAHETAIRGIDLPEIQVTAFF